MTFECVSCPVHGRADQRPIRHDLDCAKSCRDTHAYWRSVLRDQVAGRTEDVPEPIATEHDDSGKWGPV